MNAAVDGIDATEACGCWRQFSVFAETLPTSSASQACCPFLLKCIEAVIFQWRDKMATRKQRSTAKRNIKKASAAAKRRRTIAHLPKSVRTALGKQAASVAKRKRKAA